MSDGKMVLTIVPSMMTSEIAIDTKTRPIHRLREAGTMLNSLKTGE
jgi:hypothetical protein